MIYGNIEGIKKSIIEELEGIYSIKTLKDEVCSTEILDIISRISSVIEREVSVGINRKGSVTSVAIGDSTSVEVPVINIEEKRLAGVRVIHTHPNGYCNLSALDLTALLKLKLDSIVSVAVIDGKIIDFSLGMLTLYNNKLETEEKSNLSLEDIMSVNILDKIKFIENLIKTNDVIEETEEKAILVGSDTKESLEELKELTEACNIPVLNTVFQSRNKIDAAFYIGRGKVLEIANMRQVERANVIIFDDELSGSQVRNLEAAIGAKVIDRTTLILEIFATRAKTKEAKIQVELAQLKYRLSRLQGLGTVLSRTGGGIGTRGPGEQKLEIDRRLIKERITQVRKELEQVKRTRELTRKKRQENPVPVVAIVGYTNAGKSTLLNKLTGAGVLSEDKLFATLDPTTRKMVLEGGEELLFTDTVGFIRKLPHHLIQAFRSTLEEAKYADVILHVVDASNPDMDSQMFTVYETLRKLEVGDKKVVTAFNKIDALEEEISLKDLQADRTVRISAKYGDGLDEMLSDISEVAKEGKKTVEKVFGYDEASVVNDVRKYGQVLEEEYRNEGIYIKASIPKEYIYIFEKTEKIKEPWEE